MLQVLFAHSVVTVGVCDHGSGRVSVLSSF